MAENTEEEYLDSPTNTHSDNSSEEIIPSNDTKAINLNQETENMEVHHHGHHVHEKKTWKSYFWEFFMLFLAVFCGFLAEIQVEHYVEHQKEKAYVKTLLEDLVADTVKLNSVINNFENFIPIVDSFVSLIDNGNIEKQEQTALNYVFKTAYWYDAFKKNDRTINQLNNAGNFRLIRIQTVSNAILNYDNFCNSVVSGRQAGMTQVINKMQTVFSQVFDMTFARSLFNEWQKIGKEPQNILITKSYIINNDNQKLHQLKNSVFEVWVYTQGYLVTLKQTKQEAIELIQLIKKQYNL
jgi:hypothetical protein